MMTVNTSFYPTVITVSFIMFTSNFGLRRDCTQNSIQRIQHTVIIGNMSKPQLKNSRNMITSAWYTVGRNMLPRCCNYTQWHTAAFLLEKC